MRDPNVDSRRRNSSETSIDVVTADPLLANHGFSAPASPLRPRTGDAMTYANPTPFAFHSYPKTGSNPPLAQHQRVPTPASSHSYRSSIFPNGERETFAIAPAFDTWHSTGPLVRQGSTVDLIGAYNNNVRVSHPNFPFRNDKDDPAAQSKTHTTSRRCSTKVLVTCLLLVFFLAAAGAMIPVGFLVLKPMLERNATSKPAPTNSDSVSNTDGTQSGDHNGTSNSTVPSPSNTTSTPDPEIPPSAVGTVLDSTKWLDWTDFNLTYTNATVGGLAIMVGLYL